LYGAGFYYIPGTDTCLKVGGYVRLQTGYGFGAGGLSNGPQGANDVANRTTNDFQWRVRAHVTFDARSQTEYGTLRSYLNVGTLTSQGTGGTYSTTRAFTQIAGFTFGLAESFYDYFSFAPYNYNGGLLVNNGDQGDPGHVVWGYTAQLGNGLSASLAAEAPRDAAVTRGTGALLTATNANQQGDKYPDLVANLRVDQAWGSAQIMGALHDASAGYYTGSVSNHPGDALGYGVGAGVKFNLPMLGKGDNIAGQVNYSKGASGYAMSTTSYGLTRNSGNEGAYGLVTDGVYGSTTGDVELTEAWSVGAAYQHNWNSKWKTSLYGSYNVVNYNDTANTTLCGGVVANCDNDFSHWSVGTRTEWMPVANFTIGVDVIYQHLNTASDGLTSGAVTYGDQDDWTAHMRIQRNFWP
jgi:hypothetical protein